MDKETHQLSDLQDAISNEAGLIAYFYNDNCAPCKSLRPKVLELLDREFPKMNILFINSEKHPEISAEYGVFSNPTLLVYFDRKEYLRKSKYISIPELKSSIQRLYDMMFS